MQTRKIMTVLGLIILLVGTSSLFAQEGASCTDCHNDTTLITGKTTAWETSMHATGTAYGRGTSGSCAGCHSGGGFSAAIAAGLTVDQASGDPTPTRQDCRACHQIHTSYTGGDWALETTDSVMLFAFEAGSSALYDGGKGNLCANCHQPRRTIDAADPNGMINVSSSHWGPHHGPQSAMLLGIGGAGAEGEASGHSWMVEDTCVTCHLGENMNHNFEPVASACTTCHEDATNMDINGVQTEVAALIAEVAELLQGKGLLDEEGHPVVGLYPAAQAAALWDYIFISIEDGSLGVHNASYTKALLEAAKVALQ
jgi:hypothetical protein